MQTLRIATSLQLPVYALGAAVCSDADKAADSAELGEHSPPPQPTRAAGASARIRVKRRKVLMFILQRIQ